MKHNQTQHRSRSRTGFTLVELLVVIGIIALLISILLPTLASARRSANSVKCLSNQRQMGTALVLFSQEHQGYIPKAWFNDYARPAGFQDTLSGQGKWGFKPNLWGWDYVLKSAYLDGSNDVFLCPSDNSGIVRGTWNDPGGNRFGDWPADEPDRSIDNIPASYRYNISNQPRDFMAIKLTDLGNATRAIMVSDGNASGFHHFMTQTQNVADEGNIGPGRDRIRNAAPYRHTAEGQVLRGSGDDAIPIFKLNASFADGHAESVGWNQTWEPTGNAVQFHNGTARGPLVVGIPTMWRQYFEDGAFLDQYDNPNTDADDANPR